MDSGFYSACSGLAAQLSRLDIAASNLANVNTTAYKSQQPVFRSVLLSATNDHTSQAVNNFAALNGTRLNFAHGQLIETGNDFDLALEGAGFFSVETKHGVKYTRNGQFRLAADRTVVTANGDPVLGESGPVRLPAGRLSVSGDGTISVDGALVGRLRIVDFAGPTASKALGNTYIDAPDNAVRPAEHRNVRQHALEQSNVDAIAEAVNLVALQRHAEMLQRAMSMFHTEMNRVVAEEIPRV